MGNNQNKLRKAQSVPDTQVCACVCVVRACVCVCVDFDLFADIFVRYCDTLIVAQSQRQRWEGVLSLSERSE